MTYGLIAVIIAGLCGLIIALSVALYYCRKNKQETIVEQRQRNVAQGLPVHHQNENHDSNP